MTETAVALAEHAKKYGSSDPVQCFWLQTLFLPSQRQCYHVQSTLSQPQLDKMVAILGPGWIYGMKRTITKMILRLLWVGEG